jgi:hypothetical protein
MVMIAATLPREDGAVLGITLFKGPGRMTLTQYAGKHRGTSHFTIAHSTPLWQPSRWRSIPLIALCRARAVCAVTARDQAYVALGLTGGLAALHEAKCLHSALSVSVQEPTLIVYRYRSMDMKDSTRLGHIMRSSTSEKKKRA